MKSLGKMLASVLGVSLIIALATVASPGRTFAAASTQGVPDQASCDNGSVTLTWASMAIARPQIATMTVDGEAVADPTHPTVGSLGATICAGTAQGARTGLSIYRHIDPTTNDFDLTGAVTPLTATPLTSTSKITITMTNMGDLAQYFSFALVHGTVSNWSTANLGTSSASLSVTLTPTRTPFGTGTDFGGCTATPPNCNAAKSDVDALSASLDMSFAQGDGGTAFRGAYFALTGAMGGFVSSQNNSDGTTSLVASLGGPHMLADGITSNVGNMQAFLPTALLENLLHVTSGSLSASDLTLSRTESGTTSSAAFTLTAVTGGAVISVPDITFSSPAYTIKKAAAVATTAVPGLPNTGQSAQESSSTSPVLPVAAFLAIISAFYAVKKLSDGR